MYVQATAEILSGINKGKWACDSVLTDVLWYRPMWLFLWDLAGTNNPSSISSALLYLTTLPSSSYQTVYKCNL